MRPSRSWLLPGLIFIFALALRLLVSTESYWLDEGASIQIATRLSPDLLGSLGPDFHPPFFYLLLKSWLAFVPSQIEWLVRLPFIILSSLSVIVVYYIARLLAPSRPLVGVIAGLLLATSPFHIYYSVELRMYGLTALFVALSWYYLLADFKRDQAVTRYLYWLWTVLSLYTFYGALFSLVGQLIFISWHKKTRLLKKTLLIIFLSCLPLVPLIYTQLLSAQVMTQALPGWTGILGQLDLKNLILIPVKLLGGRLSFEPKTAYIVTSLIWSALILGMAWISRARAIYASWIITPIVISLLISFFTPVLSYHRFVYILPGIYVLLALTIVRFKMAYFFTILFLTVHIVIQIFYVISPHLHREDWAGLSALADQTRLDIVISYPVVIAPLTVYSGQYRVIPAQSRFGVIDQFDYPNQFLYTSYLSGLTDPEGLLQSFLDRHYRVIKTYNLNQLGDVSIYSL
jgi:uncharacterized membrane protein